MVLTSSKTLFYPDVPKIKNLQQAEEIIRQHHDAIEELMRRVFSAAPSDRWYLAKVTAVGSVNYSYTCTLYHWSSIAEQEEYNTGVTVLNLIDEAEQIVGADGKGLVVGNYMMCKQDARRNWVGFELHGRSTIGLC